MEFLAVFFLVMFLVQTVVCLKIAALWKKADRRTLGAMKQTSAALECVEKWQRIAGDFQASSEGFQKTANEALAMLRKDRAS
jgi:hypothetical protein